MSILVMDDYELEFERDDIGGRSLAVRRDGEEVNFWEGDLPQDNFRDFNRDIVAWVEGVTNIPLPIGSERRMHVLSEIKYPSQNLPRVI